MFAIASYPVKQIYKLKCQLKAPNPLFKDIIPILILSKISVCLLWFVCIFVYCTLLLSFENCYKSGFNASLIAKYCFCYGNLRALCLLQHVCCEYFVCGFRTFESEGLHIQCWPFPGLLKYRMFKML